MHRKVVRWCHAVTRLRGLLLTGVGLMIVTTAQAQGTVQGTTPADPPGTIVLMADAKAGVKLIGAAKLAKVTGKPEDIKNLGMDDEPLIQLGKWSKPNPEEIGAVFSPTIPRDGLFDVYVRWYTPNYAGGCAKSFPYQINHAQGSRTLEFTQQMGNVWAFLGTFPFKAGTSGNVTALATGVYGASNINGIKLVPVSAPPATMPKVLPKTSDKPDDFERMRIRLADWSSAAWDADITDPQLAQKVAQQEADVYFHWKTMKLGPGTVEVWSQPAINRDIAKNEGGGWMLYIQYQRLYRMASSYVGSNAPLGFASKLQGNPELLKDILAALKFFYENRYNERTVNKLGGDWISNEILCPLHISRTIALIYPHVPQDFIAKQIVTFDRMAPTPLKMYGGAGQSTGFNRMVACYAFAARGLIANDAKRIEFARDGIGEEFEINRRSKPIMRAGKPNFDGFYDDGSFIQHVAFPYVGIYGGDVLTNYAPLKALLEGSRWAINDPRSQVFNRWVTDGIAPLFFNGDIMYGSIGRSAGQSWAQNGTVSSRLIDGVAGLVPLASTEDDRKLLSSILKAWMIDKEKSTPAEFNQLVLNRITFDSFKELSRIRKDNSIQPLRPKPGTYVFHNTDYVIHQQPEFAAQLRMFSTRIKTHEDIDGGTNRLGWYQGEGTLFVYTKDTSRYNDNFWATVNPYRLPGITVAPHPRETPGSKDGDYSQSPWAGGAQLPGAGMASMGLMATTNTLTAKKSWYFLDDQIVCLGSDIKCTDPQNVETIVENAKLFGRSDNPLLVNGSPQPVTLDWKADLTDVRWMHLTGNLPGTDIAWYFPQPATLKAVREARSGDWLKWFIKDSPAVHTRNYVTFWFDHGSKPTSGSYAYIVLPNRSADQIKTYAQTPAVKVLANTEKLHAIACPGKSLIAASVWTPQPTVVGDITVTGACNLIVIDDGTQLQIAVSDPTQLLTTPIRLEFKKPVKKMVSADQGLTVDALSPLRITVNPAQSDGKTYRAVLQY